MLPDPKSVFLDETTGHIDEETEKLVETTVENELKNITVIAIAHRLSSISGFDRFFKIEDGKVIEMPRSHVSDINKGEVCLGGEGKIPHSKGG